jgi:hypothetical protein
MGDIASAISSLGFPIAACCALGWYFVKVQEQQMATISKLSDAFNNNTLALTKLSGQVGSLNCTKGEQQNEN